MKDTVVVFTRAPRLGAVKRRLARDIGDRAALRFHVATMTRLVRALAADRRFRTVVAVTPDRARLSLPVKQIPQGCGDLGMRMHRAFGRYRCGRVAIIGCDIPEAGPRDLLAAFRALGSADAVFGPATDGGYWLVAMAPRRPARPFTRVRWSTRHALADTVSNFMGRRIVRLRVLSDVDTVDDWRKHRSGLDGTSPRRHVAGPSGGQSAVQGG
jgi:rSAM/selenodomain-associated transferase 1